MLIFSFLMLVYPSLAQAESYPQAMASALEPYAAAKSAEEWQAAAEGFEKIADAHPDEWMPTYYAGMSYLQKSFTQKVADEKDASLDQAQSWVDMGLKLAPDESEMFVLAGMVYQGRIQVKPIARGMRYSQAALDQLDRAIELNPDNPRAYLMQGQHVLNMPPFVGGGKDNACPIIMEAMDLFKEGKAPEGFAPSWGKDMAERLVKACAE